MIHGTESINQESKNTPISTNIKKTISKNKKAIQKQLHVFENDINKYIHIYTSVFFIIEQKIKSTNFKQYYFYWNRLAINIITTQYH